MAPNPQALPETSALSSTYVEDVTEALESVGAISVSDAVSSEFVTATQSALYGAQKSIHKEIPPDRLSRARELGVARIPMKWDAHFFRFFELPAVLDVIDATVGETAICHLQNGFILPSRDDGEEEISVFQNTMHRDFPRYLNGYCASINTFFAMSDFTPAAGGTKLLPATHQRPDSWFPPDTAAADAIDFICPAGTMLVFDSTLWHAAGDNVSGSDRLAINHQWTKSFLKQQIDYVRALGDEVVLRQAPRTQQLLGWYTRVVTSLDAFYRPAEERLYRSGQG